ncbi:hypothetical protein OBBRIDRAFT_784748 [Obba rivulosa]|uniref:MYND-type domain-containing protein n=1 Tax=Obba rivulosa TaxID=1052685 RepID=A0A8E2AJS9_9APHY|nr:hypothetical protein OBBRIDRAFT_784748 [Obba rivulosa]
MPPQTVESKKDVLNASFARVHPGYLVVSLPHDFALPSMLSVREDVEELTRLGDRVFHPLQPPTGSGLSDPFPPPLAWTMRMKNLSKFSLYANVMDVPRDLFDPVASALFNIIQSCQESCEEELCLSSWYLPHDKRPGQINSILLFNAHYKLTTYLSGPTLDRPFSALPHYMVLLETIKRDADTDKPLWFQYPTLYEAYADALVLCGIFTDHTRQALEHVIEAADSQCTTTPVPAHARLMSRIHLSNVLLRLGKDPEAQKEHTDWAARLLRKNPRLILVDKLYQVLARDDQEAHPVLIALGGRKWLESVKRAPTAGMDDRMLRRCYSCGAREPHKTLFRCAGCESAWYCSRQCQKANWSMHKEACKNAIQYKARLQELRETDPSTAQLVEDYMGWRDAACSNRLYAFSCALGLHRDPSRGRTHVILGELEYTPQASKDVRYKFRVTKCGVFRITDVLSDIELVAELKAGEGKRYVEKYIREADAMDRSGGRTPILVFMLASEFQPVMKPYSWALHSLRDMPHDPEWRRLVNKCAPPGTMKLRSGAKDAEHVF